MSVPAANPPGGKEGPPAPVPDPRPRALIRGVTETQPRAPAPPPCRAAPSLPIGPDRRPPPPPRRPAPRMAARPSMANDDAPLLILHGGEAAREVAGAVSEALKKRGLKGKLARMDDHAALWEGKSKGQRRCLFVVQTVENDMPAEEAGKAVRFFTKSRNCKFCSNTTAAASKGAAATKCGGRCPYVDEEGCSFASEHGVAYAVIAVGDTNLLLDRQTTTAKDCNAAGQKLDRALAALGGTRLLARCDANEAEGLELAVDPWVVRLGDALAASA